LKFSLLFCFVFATYHFRFASDAKTSEKTLFSPQSEKNFSSVSLQSVNDVSFCFFFVLFLLRSIFISLQISTFRINAKQAKKPEQIFSS
jgi:hypothetical protein